MSKEVNFEPRYVMLRGLDIAANAVSGTLGPKGRNVYIDDSLAPKFTNDGASIAMQIVLENNLENAGAKILKNTTGQTNDDAGDGTTTTAVLVQAIIHECILRPENPMVIRESLLEAGKKIVPQIRKVSQKIKKEDIRKVAYISAENINLAGLISDIINEVGEDAVITIEDSLDFSTSYETVNGYEAYCGFLDTRFINDIKKARCVMENVPILVTEKKISAFQDVQPLWTQFQEAGITSCVIICDDIEPSMLGVFIASKITGKFNAVVIKSVGDALKDIEAAVGATRISDTTGVTFQNIKLEHLGKAKKVVSDANKTLFIPTDPQKAIRYANHLQKFSNEERNMYIKQRLDRRIAQLKGGVVVMKIGGQDFEREYLKDKADDAIKACKAALEEGVVEGGGLTLYRISEAMKPKSIGEEILKNALKAPFKKILENAGLDYAQIVKDMPKGYGYDARGDEYIPLIANGIIDPAKVTRCALENAIANAAQFITMFCSITDYVKPDSK